MKSEQSYRERECIHRARGAVGETYPGKTYVQHLQRLHSRDAMKFAGNVSPFFWSDAAQIVVWLCDDCAASLGLKEWGAVVR